MINNTFLPYFEFMAACWIFFFDRLCHQCCQVKQKPATGTPKAMKKTLNSIFVPIVLIVPVGSIKLKNKFFSHSLEPICSTLTKLSFLLTRKGWLTAGAFSTKRRRLFHNGLAELWGDCWWFQAGFQRCWQLASSKCQSFALHLWVADSLSSTCHLSWYSGP